MARIATLVLILAIGLPGLTKAEGGDDWHSYTPASDAFDSAAPGGLASGRALNATPVDTFDPLQADRPDFTESPSIMGLGRLQLEGGWIYLHDKAGGVRADMHVLPELLLRYGLTEAIELRLAWPGYASLEETDQRTGQKLTYDGVADMGIGCKLQLSRQDGCRPETALITSISAPVGATAWTSGRVDNRIDYIYGWDMTDRVSLAGSTGAWWTKYEEDHYTVIHQSAVLGLGLTERLGSYIEWFGLFFEGSGDDRPDHYLNGGFTYLVTEDLQLDWRIGVGLTESADDLFTGVGFAIRW